MENQETQENKQPKRNYGSVLLVIGLAGTIFYFGWSHLTGLGEKPVALPIDSAVVAVDSVKVVKVVADSLQKDSAK